MSFITTYPATCLRSMRQLRGVKSRLTFNQVSRMDYLRRHVSKVLPYLTVRKLANLVMNMAEWKLKVPAPRSWPPYLKVESTPVCQLSCTGCSHHDLDFKKQFHPAMNLTLAQFRHMVDPVAEFVLGISFSLRGEPLLNRELPKIVKYAHDKKIATSFPTNLSMRLDEKIAADVVCSGLDAMYVSLDGASADSYSEYRIGGDFDCVLRNVKLLADTKAMLKRKNPRLIWKFVIFDYNVDEVEIARQKYAELGFDDCEFVPDWGGEIFKQKKEKFNRNLIERKVGCYFAWNAMVMTSEGDVRPCCADPAPHLGNAMQDGIREMWRSKSYRDLRRGFATRTFGETMHPVCKACIGLTGSVASGTKRARPTLVQLQAGSHTRSTASLAPVPPVVRRKPEGLI